jgi:hypothetical protein
MTADVSDLLAHNYVITSLDIAPSGYGVVATAPVSGMPAYTANSIDTDRAGLAAWTADEGRRGHVVTAVTPTADGSALRALSFARAGDATVYETEVVDATFATLAASAMALAGGGYIFTACGRNGDGPLLLIGTRPMGVAAPRTITVQNEAPTLGAQGVLVAWVLDAPIGGGFSQLSILEQ